MDIDVVARLDEGEWVQAAPLPEPLVSAVRRVAAALDLAQEPRDQKDWLNSGPYILMTTRLPDGLLGRAAVHRFGGLTLHVAARSDLITLKLWAATDSARGARRELDIADLQRLDPTFEELRVALDWCRRKHARDGFLEFEASPVLGRLGFRPTDFAR